MGAKAARGVPRQRRVMLVGISDRAVQIGLSFPLPYVRRWNAEYAGPEAAQGYSSVTIEVADKGAITAVAARARTMGLGVVDSGAEQAGLAITLVTLLFALVSLSIIAIATINIGHTFFRAVIERRREIGVLRAIGASRRDIELALLGEAAAVGASGGIVGLAVARLLGLGLDLASHRYVPDFPFKPESYFAFSGQMYAAILAFAVVACIAGAALPARRAARMEPADALSAT
jgi:ABC-type antimicrobial peptide transport system permease subunit